MSKKCRFFLNNRRSKCMFVNNYHCNFFFDFLTIGAKSEMIFKGIRQRFKIWPNNMQYGLHSFTTFEAASLVMSKFTEVSRCHHPLWPTRLCIRDNFHRTHPSTINLVLIKNIIQMLFLTVFSFWSPTESSIFIWPISE